MIFGMSSLPGSAVPGRYGTIAHFLEYAVLAALVLWATHDRRLPTGDVVLAVALAAAWGVTDELHQAFVPLRVPDQVDWLVDVLGAIAGATVLSELLRARDRLARQ